MCKMVKMTCFLTLLIAAIDGHSQFVATLSGGPSWTSKAQVQTIYLEPDVLKTYTVDNGSNVAGNLALFLAAQWPISRVWLAQLGIDIAGVGNMTFNGDIWEDGKARLNNYTYKYHIDHGRVGAKGKLQISPESFFVQPYVSAGIGVSSNRASGFTITPKICEEVSAPAFTSNTQTTLAYSLGVGVQAPISTHFSGGIGYEFASLGKANLGRAPEQTLNTGLSFQHIYNNALMFNVTYLS